VLDVARDNVRKAGIGARCEFLAGNAFEIDLGEGYDVILLANFLHHFNRADCETFLRKARGALKPDGRVLTFEFIADEDRVSPPVPATFSMMMLGTTPEGEVYTFSDLRDMFMASGYSGVELKPIPPAKERVLVSYR
jgi:ubiquinone/menaquinone biosynthesis C-methylase UbiE